jgi:lysozyme
MLETDTNLTRLLTQLKRDEGIRLTLYDDADGARLVSGSAIKGNPTIGIGRNVAGDGISEAEAEQLCLNDVQQRESLIVKSLPFTARLDPVRFAVLVNLAFAGVHRLMEFRDTIACLERGDFAGTAAQILNSKLAKEWGARAQRLALQMKSGVWQ